MGAKTFPVYWKEVDSDHMRFEGVFEVLISITDFRYLELNGAQYGPGLALFGEIVMPDCTKL